MKSEEFFSELYLSVFLVSEWNKYTKNMTSMSQTKAEKWNLDSLQ